MRSSNASSTSRLVLEISGVEEATLLARPNRFTAVLEAAGREFTCHIHDPGRIPALRPGTRVLYKRAWRPGRRTSCDLVAFYDNDMLVLEDTRLPNKLFEKVIPLIYGGASYERERQILGSRFDFIVSVGNSVRIVEVKATNYAVGPIALWPDAPSKRGLKHVETLRMLRLQGFEAELAILALRGDVEAIAPNGRADPLLARSLCIALEAGVAVRGLRFSAERAGDKLRIMFSGTIPFRCA
ncbi:DNA/RNA nuclease SfsA [Hyperthermus butylicus]|uniref:Sugar fermentation stimulation protein n=1 Tax=Hyperthermus butylicus (strain DSM 5456 / JCM 9403 / PLM1-5) TaxID=415426 RepID=A2BMY3_HYPBU|nr:DNA/RNA nuclease SfsA [Hyperthermus butylicus]ABM81344.1 Sugar fermentation stimulation protein [Hyperthermus butylicus DSM 5456]